VIMGKDKKMERAPSCDSCVKRRDCALLMQVGANVEREREEQERNARQGSGRCASGARPPPN
jgi:hypothetical protein